MSSHLSSFIDFIHSIGCIDSRCFGTFPLRGWGNVGRELVNEGSVLPVSRLRSACFFAVSAQGKRRNARKSALRVAWAQGKRARDLLPGGYVCSCVQVYNCIFSCQEENRPWGSFFWGQKPLVVGVAGRDRGARRQILRLLRDDVPRTNQRDQRRQSSFQVPVTGAVIRAQVLLSECRIGPARIYAVYT